MKIPKDAHIPKEKLEDYLLAPRKHNDKSKFLGKAGFTKENPEDLEHSLRSLISEEEARLIAETDYGEMYEVKGDLQGTNGNILSIISIWIKRAFDQIFQFVTLTPWKK
jgi:hypothetical protein